MGFAIAKALVLLQLSSLCFYFSVSGEEIEAVPLPPIPPNHHAYHHHYPAMAPAQHHHPPSVAVPVHPPAHAPVHRPTPHSTPTFHPPAPSPPVHPLPPAHPPTTYHFPRSFVAVQGVVYLKPCKYAGVDTLMGASPVLGATIKLQCNNTKYQLQAKATTDKNGYFFLEAPKTITTYGAHKCKVWLVSSSNPACGKPSDLHGGVSGGVLRPEKSYVAKKLPFVLYTVGPFAFEPKCPHH